MARSTEESYMRRNFLRHYPVHKNLFFSVPIDHDKRSYFMLIYLANRHKPCIPACPGLHLRFRWQSPNSRPQMLFCPVNQSAPALLAKRVN
jgi:hypothetical protein